MLTNWLRADIDRGELVGLARSRCDRGSRWVGYTFQRRDEGKPVRVLRQVVVSAAA